MLTFKEQMELRRSLMDLSNTGMEIRLESNRHMAIIAEWESEQMKVRIIISGNIYRYYPALTRPSRYCPDIW